MKLYLVRHGETDWNRANKVLGRTDIPLNETGRRQAKQLAERLSGIPLNLIYTSPLSRAVQTGQTIAEKQLTCGCRAESRLIEQDFGVFEGVPRDDPSYQAEKRNYFRRYPGGESYFDVVARVYPFLYQMRDTAGEDKKVLIVTHGGICRIITNYFQEMSNEEFASFTMRNCEIREFTL
ncbi:MAG: histidine phosphatase family protein [Clostridiales bacterium]|nr:histidine phosphatase family protein [Clostridiales bacterium]